MDSINSNLYPSNSTNKVIFGGYVRNPCAQQPQRHFLPPFAMPMSNNMTQPLMYNTQNQPIYNIMYTHQSMYRNQDTFSTFPQETWQDSCLKTTTDYKDKYENRNDCCLETKNFYNYNKNSLIDPNWYYGTNYENQKYTELPSCSQIGSNNLNSCCNITEKTGKSVKYCSIQKLPEVNSKIIHCSKPYDNLKDYSSCAQFSQPYNTYSSSTFLEQIDKKKCILNSCDMSNLDNQYEFIDVSAKPIEKIEDNNGNESDIIVENSEEESEDSDIEKEDISCLVCHLQIHNISYYDITLEKTVTSFTRTRISEKLFQILGWIPIEKRSKFICNICMSLLNNLDNLEKQSNFLKIKILEKFKTNDLSANSAGNLQKPKFYFKKHKNYSFRCPLCKKCYSFKKFYNHHIASHRKKTYFCWMCKMKFTTLSQFKIHCAKKHTNNPKFVKRKGKKPDYICCLCGRSFKSITNLKEHEILCSGKLPFECSLCKKCFPSQTKMKQHLKFHEKDFKVSCEICAKGFIKNCDYKKHLLSHSSDKSFKCTVCGNLYKTQSNLNQHKKSHDKTLPFNCEICNKGFLRKELLDCHLNNHNGTKPFKCKFCDKKFSMQKYLSVHLKIHEGTSQKKTCNICGKQIKNSLVEHMRLHSNVKNFECLKCYMKFQTKGALSKHIKRKHQITQEVIDIVL